MSFTMHTRPNVDLQIDMDILNYSGTAPAVFSVDVFDRVGNKVFFASAASVLVPGQFVQIPSGIVIRFFGLGIQANGNDVAAATFSQAGGGPQIDPPGNGQSIAEPMHISLKTFAVGVVQ